MARTSEMVWRARIFHDDGDIEHYYFADERDLCDSIAMTWARRRARINMVDQADDVAIIDRSTGVVVLHASRSIALTAARSCGLTIMDCPTHFLVRTG
jgi:hypothetical protein